MAIQNDIQWDATDAAQLAAAEIPQSEATRQLRQLREGAPYAEIVAPAGSEKGIYRISIEEERQYLDLWEQYRQSRYASMLKFVPASGAASRMFKMLYPLLDQSEQESLTEEQQTFLDHIEAFAFAQQLNETSLRKLWMSVSKLLEMGRRKELIELLLTDKGMNYGSTPKGMILFHRYEHERRSAAAEHLVEGALYEKDRDGHVAIHFTVAPDELELFKSHVERYRQKFEDDFGVLFDITYSTQCRSTDTIAIDSTGEPFRNNDGSLLLRPGGHGSLLKNLNEQDAEVIFIKNIDNVTPDYLKGNTVRYKKLLGGILIATAERIKGYMEQLDRSRVSRAQLEEMELFLRDKLCIELNTNEETTDKELADLIREKLDRPIRVCGMVKNEGEPGGGPYIVRDKDGTTSLQILETSQIDMNNERAHSLWKESSFFNPVDLVCCMRNYKGEPFDLTAFVNHDTAFLSQKSKDGRDLIALEHPGLWNGAMYYWNTLFVEVPADTFTPVKTVLDLLRPQHQPIETENEKRTI